LSKRDILNKVVELKKFNSQTDQEKDKIQKQMLFNILEYCEAEIPYYKEIFKQTSFDPKKILNDQKHILDLPILTKDIVRERLHDIRRITAIHPRKTGGSTGQSVHFFYDNEGLDWTAAINILAYENAGKKRHHTDCHIGAEIGLAHAKVKDKIIHKLKLMSQNRIPLLITSFADSAISENLSTLSKIQPYLLQGHPSTAYALASYIEKTNSPFKKICTIFEPSGEMLTPQMVKKIETNLGCRVVNRYGNAEFGVIAHSSLEGNFETLDVFNRCFYIEDADSSRIIVSGLTNYGMPLLRYDTGDIGTVKNTLGKTEITNIQGRVHDKIKLGNDEFPTHYIMDYLDHKIGGIRQFQIILKDHLKPVINIVAESSDDHARITSLIEKRWPNAFFIEFILFDGLLQVGWRQKFRHVIDLRFEPSHT
jgi:phenylacetate-CoA ligase